MAPSLEKAQMVLDVAVVQPMPQIKASTSRGTSRPKAPPAEPTADLRIDGTGWPDARATRPSIFGMTKTMGIKMSRPAKKLRITVPTMALGTCVAGARTSSHILSIVSQTGRQKGLIWGVGLSIRYNHAGRRGTVSRLQKTHAERPAWDPTGAGFKGGEDVFGAVATVLCYDQDADHDCYRAGEGQEDGSSLYSKVDQ